MYLMKDVLLYTRSQCPLCDEAKSLLQLFNVNISERDIETNDDWQLKYGLMIPVIVLEDEEIYGKELCFEKLSERLNG